VSYDTDGTTVGPKAIYTVLASCIEISGRCGCDFARVFGYDIASADNITADFAQTLVEHVDAGIVPIAVFHGRRFEPRLRFQPRESALRSATDRAVVHRRSMHDPHGELDLEHRGEGSSRHQDVQVVRQVDDQLVVPEAPEAR
jgi:hypothetical protein